MQVVYDTECYPNFWAFGARTGGINYTFEISKRRNQTEDLYRFLTTCKRMIGFNNMSYDWPMMANFLRVMSLTGTVTANAMWEKNQEMFATHFLDKYRHVIWKPAIEQVDLFSIHHLDRFNIGLKQIEMTLRAPSVKDLPFEPGTTLTHEQMDVIVNEYLPNDLIETERLYIKSKGDIEYRETLGPEWINYNDGKIGKKFFERELVKAGVRLYEDEIIDEDDNAPFAFRRRSVKRQTPRPHGVALASVVLPLVSFTRPALQQMSDLVKSQVIQEHDTKGGFKTSVDLDGFKIDIGLGGIHGSIEKQSVSDTRGRIRDFDVTSYYPTIAIEHKIYPEHLGPKFCEVYAALKQRRIGLSKKDPIRSTLKFALNVPFGDSNSPHGVFYDPAYMLAITLNGQLMLCMLAEQFANAGVRILQVNTDGVTVQEAPGQADAIGRITAWWQGVTQMQLEETQYRRMFIRDSVNYIAETIDGERKRIGDYDHVRMRQGLSKYLQANHSQMIVPKAAEAAMLDDVDIEDFIINHADAWDFLMFRKGKLELNNGTRLPKNFRYYVSETGQGLASIYPGLKGKPEPRRIGIHCEGTATALGSRKSYSCSACGTPFGTKEAFNLHNRAEHSWKVTPAMEFDGHRPRDVDFRYYIAETEKLVIS